MSKFKPGDKVTPINMDRYTDRNSDQRKEMLGRTLVVRSVHNDEFTSVVFAGFPGKGVWQLERVPDCHYMAATRTFTRRNAKNMSDCSRITVF